MRFKKGIMLKMIIDVTGIELIPGNEGIDCPGNGEHIDKNGKYIEICCDECEDMNCCLRTHPQELCNICTDYKCPKTKAFD